MNKVVIYPGRFQPMLKHHAEVYRQLQQQFPDAKVYIGTSNKVDGDRSPFDFEEKRSIAVAHGINKEHVLQVRNPYNKDEYPFDQDNTVLIFAVGEKDMQRFPFDNIDPATGLDMTKRGEPKPKYTQSINTMKSGVLPMRDRGYITLAPNIQIDGNVASASAFRDALANAVDAEAAKKIFIDQFGKFDQEVFDLIYDKIMESKMNKQINEMRQLAGLSPLAESAYQESAPVNFSGEEPKTSTENLVLAKAGRILMDMAVGISDDELSNHISQLGGKFADGDLTDSADVMQAVRATGEHAKQVAQMLGDAFAQARDGGDVAQGEDVADEPEMKETAEVDLSDFYEEEEESFVDGELRVLFRQYNDALGEMGGYGDPDLAKCKELAKAGNVESCADHFFDSFSDQDGGELNDEDLYHSFIADIAHVVGVKEDVKDVEEAVESTSENAIAQAMEELRTLAGL